MLFHKLNYLRFLYSGKFFRLGPIYNCCLLYTSHTHTDQFIMFFVTFQFVLNVFLDGSFHKSSPSCPYLCLLFSLFLHLWVASLMLALGDCLLPFITPNGWKHLLQLHNSVISLMWMSVTSPGCSVSHLNKIWLFRVLYVCHPSVHMSWHCRLTYFLLFWIYKQ